MGKGRQRRARTQKTADEAPKPEADFVPPERTEDRVTPRHIIENAIVQTELDQQRDSNANTIVNEITLGSGVKLKLKRVSPTLLSDIASRVPQPQPPEFIVDEATGRTDTNPDDPDYRKALQDWVEDRSEAAFAASVVFGAKVIEVPDGMFRPEDDEWIEEVERAFEAIDDENSETIVIAREPAGKRFYHWLRFYAIDDDADLFKLSRILTARTAIMEGELAEMVSHFRRMAIGYPDLIGAVTGWSSADGDQIQATAEGSSFGI